LVREIEKSIRVIFIAAGSVKKKESLIHKLILTTSGSGKVSENLGIKSKPIDRPAVLAFQLHNLHAALLFGSYFNFLLPSGLNIKHFGLPARILIVQR